MDDTMKLAVNVTNINTSYVQGDTKVNVIGSVRAAFAKLAVAAVPSSSSSLVPESEPSSESSQESASSSRPSQVESPYD